MTRRSSRIVLLALVFVLPFGGTVTAQQPFRWKLADGDEFRVDVTQSLVQTVEVGPQTIEIPSTIKMVLQWRVTEVADDGVADVRQTVEQVSISMKVPGVAEQVTFDSSAKEEPSEAAAPLASVIKPMIGVRFTQKMDPQGRILEVQVPKDAFKGLESNPVLEKFFSGEAFKQMITKASPVFPEEAIEKGHTWNNAFKQSTPIGTTSFDSKFVYDGPQKKGDKSLDKFSITMTMGIESTRSRGAKVSITKQDSKGALWFDSTEGHLAESTLSQSVSMKVTSGDTVLNQTVTNSMTMTVTKE